MMHVRSPRDPNQPLCHEQISGIQTEVERFGSQITLDNEDMVRKHMAGKQIWKWTHAERVLRTFLLCRIQDMR